ncbi:MAG TPA: creatininase family protein, partial [Gemmatimonadales bacterium]|nr:creatininase family protein [Gemmatimonadales bacterium]
MNPPSLLAQATWDEVRATRYEVAVLPWGATEAHNRHLPYATDTIQCDAIAARSARIAWDHGARVLVLPTVPFGVQTGQLDVPFCLNLNPTTQTIVLRDLIRTIEPHGVGKLVILNGHGGNDFRQIIRELAPETGMLLCQVNWYTALDPAGYFDEPGDHAGEMETSLVLHLA